MACSLAITIGAGTEFGLLRGVGAVDNTGMFEMDGNIAHDSNTTPPYDWASLFGPTGAALVTPDPVNGPVLGDKWLDDTALPDTSYFSSNGAGVKDIDTLNHWGCTAINNALDKDNLLHAYAALVQIPANAPENANHTVLYLGSERGSNNGTSFAGFWLFRDKGVSCNTSTGDFNGQHEVGDLLVVSDYTNGGTSQDVTVYKWVGGNNPLAFVENGGVCPQPPPVGGSNDNACAIANTTDIAAPWSSGMLPTNTFVEAGIDLNNLFATLGGSECFTTFLAETRSSNQLTATLKDFSGGQLNTCVSPPVATTATPGGSVLPGASQHDVATITTPQNHPAPAGTITFTLCGPADVTSAGCPQGSGTQVGSPVTISSGGATSASVNGTTTPNDLAIGRYCWGALYTPDQSQVGVYLPSYHSDASSECFSVIKASPQMATQIQVTGNGDLGSTSYGDVATLTATVGSPGAGETVSFSLWGPTTGGATPTCTGTPAFTTTGALSGSGGTWTATTSQTFTPTAVGTYVWTASYNGDALNNGASEACNGANESAAIATPDLHITKTADAATVSAGSQIGFTITVSNGSGAGTSTALGVTVNDPLPGGAGISWSIASGPANCTISGTTSQTLACAAVDLAPGASESIHVVSGTTKASCAQYPNTASASQTNPARTITASASTTVLCPGLAITKTADAATVSAGSPIGFSITVSNSSAAGTGTATAVTLSDPLPPGAGITWSISPAYSGPGTCSITGSVGSQTLSCSFGDMAPGASASVHVSSPTTAASCASYSNTASASATNDGTVTASASTTVLCPALSITKTADAASVTAGTPIGFTITVSNSDAEDTGTATGVTLNDPLPAGSGISWSISPAFTGPGTCAITGSAGSQVLACSFGDMAPGASASVHVSSPTSTLSCASYTNTATATGTNASPITASASTRVTCPAANIALSPLSADDPVGDLHTLTATVTINHDLGVDQTEPAPDGTVVSFTIVSGPGTLASPSCTISNGLGTCTDVLTSSVAGTTMVNATTTVTVDGVVLQRTTGDGVPGDSADAVKNWHKVQPSITTAQSAGGTIGIAVNDTAKVSGGLNPTGTVTFQLFGPGDTTCSGTPVFVSSNQPLSGGTATSGSFTPTATGTYEWVATYNGDAANLTAVSGCGDEPVTIAAAAVLGITTPNTGAGLMGALAEGLGLLLAGTGLMVVTRRRRKGD